MIASDKLKLKERIRLMADIPFEHAGCNGWAIYEPQYIDADNGKNMHVVAGKITYHDGKKLFAPTFPFVARTPKLI